MVSLLIHNIASDLDLAPKIKPCTEFGPNLSRIDESVLGISEKYTNLEQET